MTCTRTNETELSTVDFRMSNNELFEMPAGPVGIVGGVEYREESFLDDRDPRLDGQIEFIDNDGQGFPLVSDVVNSSPTLDSSGSRNVISAFAELQVPVFEDARHAGRAALRGLLRHRRYDGRQACAWLATDRADCSRGSWSEAFRAPNLVTVNEAGVARSNTTQ